MAFAIKHDPRWKETYADKIEAAKDEVHRNFCSQRAGQLLLAEIRDKLQQYAMEISKALTEETGRDVTVEEVVDILNQLGIHVYGIRSDTFRRVNMQLFDDFDLEELKITGFDPC